MALRRPVRRAIARGGQSRVAYREARRCGNDPPRITRPAVMTAPPRRPRPCGRDRRASLPPGTCGPPGPGTNTAPRPRTPGDQVANRLQGRAGQRRARVPLILEQPLPGQVNPQPPGVIAQRRALRADRSIFLLPADDTRAQIAALVTGRPSFLAGPDTGPPLRYQNRAGHRSDPWPPGGRRRTPSRLPARSPAGTVPAARSRNSSSAWANTAEIVRPDAWACSRTAAARRTGSFTVNRGRLGNPDPARCRESARRSPRTRSSGPPAQAAPSAWPRGPRTGSSARCSVSSPGTCPGRPASASPLLWGTEQHLSGLFGAAAADARSVQRTCTWRFTSPEEFAAFFRRWYGPALKAFEVLEDNGRAALAAGTWPATGTGTTAAASPSPRPTWKPSSPSADTPRRPGKDHRASPRPGARGPGRTAGVRLRAPAQTGPDPAP